jgi:REP element-mobilizing transposase RayT
VRNQACFRAWRVGVILASADDMSRPLRLQGSGLIYHVMTRGNNKMPVFLDDLDYARHLQILDETRERFELDLWLYCEMPNHSHLVFRTRQPNLSRAMHFLDGKYAQWWNRRHGHVGHVFQARFKAQIVDACTYLLRLCRYVLANPVRANLVSHPSHWPWSCYGALTGTRAGCVDIQSLSEAIDPDHPAGVRAHLCAYVDGWTRDEEIADLIRSDRRVIGSDAFARQFAGRARRASREVPAHERRTGSSGLAQLLADSVQRGEGVVAGVYAAYDLDYTLTEIAHCAGLGTSTVTRLVKARLRADARPRLVPQHAGLGSI